ncbi:MAG: mechanosensitive ion channel [Aureispira sp.]|nr:mechanosensitive ion channel [Aureispira sp.]
MKGIIHRIYLVLAAVLGSNWLFAQQPVPADTTQKGLQPFQFNIQNYETYWDKLSTTIVTYAPRFIIGVLLLYLGFKVIARIVKLLDNIMKRNNFNEDLRPFFGTLISVSFKVLLLLSVAEIIGIETTSFVALLASIGFAIGLALQGSLSNFASGILILVFKPFKTGDMIRIDDYIGVVHEIQIFNTILMTIHNRQIVIPNSILTNGVVENITGAGVIRIEIIFGIGYNDSIDDARDTIWSVIKGCPFLVNEEEAKPHQVLVYGLNESSVDLAAWVWTKGEDYWNALYFMQEYVKKAFDKKGITIPFPQMSLHVESSTNIPVTSKNI